MNNLKKMNAVCMVHLRQAKSNLRIRILLILCLLLIYNFTGGVRTLSMIANIPVSPWTVIAIMDSFDSAVLVLLGYIFLYCDAPFLDEEQPYLILRSGRGCFVLAQFLYIAVSSAVYAIAIWGITLLCSLPRLSFSMKWGKILRTIAYDKQQGGLISLKSMIVENNPLQMFLLQILMLWLVGLFIGTFLFLMNLRFSRAVGVSLITVFVFTNMFADYFTVSHNHNGAIYYFFPVTWCNIGNHNLAAGDNYPPLLYEVVTLSLLIVLFGIISYKIFGKKEIEVLPQI